MDEAYHRLTTICGEKGIIASTDGDTQVDAHWVYHIIEEIENGCDAVGGRILTKSKHQPIEVIPFKGRGLPQLAGQSRIDDRSGGTRPLAKALSIFWRKHGCNLCYLSPGWPFAASSFFGRTTPFTKALQRMDVRIRKTPLVKAYTSTRLSGRVAVGFSEQLRKWSGYTKYGHTQDVEQAEAWLIKFKSKRILRGCWEAYFKNGFYDQDQFKIAAENLLLKPEWLNTELITTPYFGHFWEKVRKKIGRGKWGKKWELVHITEAISVLRQYVKNS